MVSLSRVGFLGRLGGIGGNLLSYTLRALFNRADTGVLAAGDLETQAPGSVQDGTIIIDDTSTGTVEVLSNEMKVVGSGAWDTTGFHSATPVPRVIGNVIGMDFRSTTNIQRAVAIVNNLASNLLADMEFWAGPSTVTAGSFDFKISGGTAIKIATYAAATTYKLRFVIGGYDVNGVPYKVGDIKANFTYGVSVYIKGGAFTTYTLIWKTSVGNAANLYKALNSFDATAIYVDNVLKPDSDKSAILQPVHLDAFTDTNGTNITAHTPDVGGAATVLSGGADIQGGQFNVTSTTGTDNCMITWPAVADGYFEIVVKQAIGRDGIVFRSTDVLNFWLAHLTATTLQIYDVQAGVFTLRSSVAITKASGDKITVSTEGNVITAFLNDTQTITFTSAFNNTATLAGIRSQDIGDKMDNFAIYNRTDPQYDALLGGF